MEVFDTLRRLMWWLVAIAALILVVAVVIKLLFKGRLDGGGRKIQVKETLDDSGLKETKDAPTGFVFGLVDSWQDRLVHRKRYVYKPFGNEGHVAIFGGSGTGKTSALLIPSLRAYPGPFFTIDISGDIERNVHCDDKFILAPELGEESATINVMAEIDAAEDDDERQEEMHQLSNRLIPVMEKDSEAEQFFCRTARDIFLAAMMVFYELGLDFCQICIEVYAMSFTELYEYVEKSKNVDALAHIKSLKTANEKNVSGAKATLDEHIRLFAQSRKVQAVLSRPEEGRVEVRCSDLEDKHIFLIVPDAKQEYYAPFQQLVVEQFMAYISRRTFVPDKDKRILFALDEFASLRLQLRQPMQKYRKQGCDIVLLTQSLADIDYMYGEGQRRIIMDNVWWTVVLSAWDTETRNYFSELVGKEDQKKESSTSGDRGGSTTSSYEQQYAIHPTVWRTLKNKLVVIHRGGYIHLANNYYYK